MGEVSLDIFTPSLTVWPFGGYDACEVTSHRALLFKPAHSKMLQSPLGGFRAAWRWLPPAVGTPGAPVRTSGPPCLHKLHGACSRLGKVLLAFACLVYLYLLPGGHFWRGSYGLSAPVCVSIPFGPSINISPLPLTKPRLIYFTSLCSTSTTTNTTTTTSSTLLVSLLLPLTSPPPPWKSHRGLGSYRIDICACDPLFPAHLLL